MRCSIVKDRLQKATVLANKIVSAKSNVPILSNILMTATMDNELLIEEAGQVTVPAKKFAEYMGSFSAETVTLQVDDSMLTVSSESGVASFMTMPASDFPEISSVDTSKPIVLIQPDDFREMIRKVVFASALGDAHPVLSGVLFDFEKGEGVAVVATDSFRLSQYQLKIEGSLKASCIIPAYALREVDAIVGETIGAQDETVINMGISPDDNQVFFKVGTVEIVSRILDAQFPPYQNIFPSQFVATAQFSKSSLSEALKTASIFASKEGNVIKLLVQSENNSIHFSSQSNDIGAYESDVIGDIQGGDVKTGFNVRYLLDAVSVIDSDTVVLQFSGETTPMLVSSTNNDVYQHLVMPMTLHE